MPPKRDRTASPTPDSKRPRVVADALPTITGRLTAKETIAVLPGHLLKLIRDVSSQEEWRKKVRFFVGYLFTRFRFIPDANVTAILSTLRPAQSYILDIDSELPFLTSLVEDMYNEIARTHEMLARAALDFTECGQSWLQLRRVHASKKMAIPNLNRVSLSESLDLDLLEVRAIWAPIRSMVHPHMWEPQYWDRTPDCSRAFFEQLQECSIELISRFMVALHTGRRDQRQLSAKARKVDLKFVANYTDPGYWPALPPTATGELPATPAAWSAWSEDYDTALNDPLFEGIFKRIGQGAHDYFNKVKPATTSISLSTKSLAGTQENPAVLSDDEPKACSGPTDVGDLECSGRPLADAPNNDASQDGIFGSFASIDSEKGQHSAPTDVSPDDTPPSPSRLERAPSPQEFTPDGYRIPNVYEDPNDDPLISTQMQADCEIPDDVFEALLDIARDEDEARTLIHHAIEFEGQNAEYIFKRAIDIARLGPAGMARYVTVLLRTGVEIQDDIINQSTTRRAKFLTLLADVEQARAEAETKKRQAMAEQANTRAHGAALTTARRSLHEIIRQNAVTSTWSGPAPVGWSSGTSSPWGTPPIPSARSTNGTTARSPVPRAMSVAPYATPSNPIRSTLLASTSGSASTPSTGSSRRSEPSFGGFTTKVDPLEYRQRLAD